METKNGVIKRRLSRIKGVCYIPGGETPYSYEIPTKEETASIVVPFMSDDKDSTAAEKVHDAFVRACRRNAKLKASGGLDSTVKKDSAFNLARNGIKTMLEGMSKTNPNATLSEAAAVWFSIPGMREQLELEGVVFGEPPANSGSTSSASTDSEDDDDDDDDE
jgi:hypothetical protein